MADELRRLGFTAVECYDPMLHAIRPGGPFDLVTAIEVAEHSVAPLDFFAEMRGFMKPAGALLFTTALQPPNIRTVKAGWWYIAPRNGHVSVFSENALGLVADRLGLDFGMAGNFHLFRPQGCAGIAEGFASPAKRAPPLLPLLAPAEGSWPGWHDPEDGIEGRFRWTASDRIVWPTGPVAGLRRVAIPLLMEISEGFAAGCRIAQGGREVPVSVVETPFARELRCDIELDPAEGGEIALLTPPPLRPIDLRGVPDTRPLGLAIRAGQSLCPAG